MNEIISYIIQFLLNDDSTETQSVGYTSNESEFHRYKVVIYPSDFFDETIYGTKKSLPALPLANFEEIPVLFGEPKIECKGDTLILHADIIAGTYFLTSRYEEMICREVRDVHGRFIGKESLPFKGRFIHRPIVDEYGKLLRKLLREQGVNVQESKAELHKIYLTHDVDNIARYRSFRGVLGALLKNPSKLKIALKSYFGRIENDPWFTFDWLLRQNNSLKNKNVETIFFIKPKGGNYQEDKPNQNIDTKDYQFLYRLLKKNKAKIGLHASYESGLFPIFILLEKKILEHASKEKITCNRHHFLASREPEDIQTLIDAEILDDFTMGYADIAGFRLGTCRAVRWINPVKKELTSLTLHPLTMMDGTLSDSRYMNLSENEAYDYAVKLINETEKHNGDLCLLWHNTAVVGGNSYHKNLYADLIDYLKNK
jgi:hypothetical protein